MTRLLLLIILTTLISCHKNEEDLDGIIFRDVIDETYIKLTKDFENISQMNEVIVNPFNDHLDSLMILRVKNDSSFNVNPEKLELLNQLEKKLNDSIKVDLNKLTKDQRFQLIDNKAEIENFDYTKESYVGSSFLSKIAINDDGNYGVFYIDFHFGDTRGQGGFFVFVKKRNGKWGIDDALEVWV
jgi:hypothetical protein